MDIGMLLDVLQRALDMENWAVKIYNDDLNRISDKRAKAMFARQAEQSSKHALQITVLMDQLKVGKDPMIPSRVVDTLRAAKTGLQEEETMRNFYRQNLNATNDARIKSLFQHLMKEEELHIKEMNSLIKYLDKLSKKEPSRTV